MLQEIIENKLHKELAPCYLKVTNESYMHNVPPGSESHFKVTVVCDCFEGERLLTRHRKVNMVLAEELITHIHALAIHTYTNKEWNNTFNTVPDSPMCMGKGN